MISKEVKNDVSEWKFIKAIQINNNQNSMIFLAIIHLGTLPGKEIEDRYLKLTFCEQLK